MAVVEIPIPAVEVEVGPNVRRALEADCPAVLLAAVRKHAAEHVDTGMLMASLDAEAVQYPYMGNPHAVAVVSSVPWADYLEYGRSGFHLPVRWGARGGRWQVSKKGTLYARVPFRHRTPVTEGQGASTWGIRQEMPPEVYAQALALSPYQETREALTGFGLMYSLSRPYELFRERGWVLPYYLGAEGYTWRASRYERLVRVTATTPGGGRHTQYMTWRTITPQSEGWYIPPVPPAQIFQRGLAEAEPIVRDLLLQAAAADLMDALRAALAEGGMA